MNPIFIILVFAGGVALWALLNPLFRFIGEKVSNLVYDIKAEMSDKTESEDN